MVQASSRVAGGDLEIRVPSEGNDEVAVLAHAFNQMVTGLQEGFIYRDLLGRTVSPEVREAMRSSFASGTLKLEGQNTVATVLMSDIRGYQSFGKGRAGRDGRRHPVVRLGVIDPGAHSYPYAYPAPGPPLIRNPCRSR
jgi:hypothetical protein